MAANATGGDYNFLFFLLENSPQLRKIILIVIVWHIGNICHRLVFATDESGEPLSFTDGISLWPTIFIQIIAILLASHFSSELGENLTRIFATLSAIKL